MAEPTIQRQGARRIVVELPGVTDHEQAIDVIGQTAVLEILDPLGRVALTGADLRDARVGLEPFNQRPSTSNLRRKAPRSSLASPPCTWVRLSRICWTAKCWWHP